MSIPYCVNSIIPLDMPTAQFCLKDSVPRSLASRGFDKKASSTRIAGIVVNLNTARFLAFTPKSTSSI